jgi:tetratricopeptide (TPR) repeat protein
VEPSDRQRRRQLLREAEGYLELVLAFTDQYPLAPRLRDTLGEAAIRAIDRVGEPGGDRFHAMYLKGQALRCMERYAQAVVPFEEAATIIPEDIDVHLALGWCYKRMGRLDRAIEALETALAAEPDKAILYYNLACYWSLAHNKKHALEYLSRALAMDSHYRDLIDQEPDFDSLRLDPDFQSLTSVIV